MDPLTFVANLVGSVAWPTAAVILAFAFRVPLKEILERLTKLEALGVKADFDKKLKEAEKQAEKADLPPAPRQPALQDDRPPSSRVFQAWRELESHLNDVFTRHTGSPPRSYTALRDFLHELETKGVIPRESIALFNDLRAIRNRAVHPRSDSPDVSSLQADEFANLTARLIEQLKRLDTATVGQPRP